MTEDNAADRARDGLGRSDADLLRLIAKDHARLALNAHHSASTLLEIAARLDAATQPPPAHDRMREALADIFEHYSDRDQAPGHSHDIPGIWDTDNEPALAGKPCDWCAKWESARAALQAQEAE